jgi:hypothetical protein
MQHGLTTTTAPANHNPIEDRRPICARSATPIHPAQRNKRLAPFSDHEPAKQHSTNPKSIASKFQLHRNTPRIRCGPVNKNTNHRRTNRRKQSAEPAESLIVQRIFGLPANSCAPSIPRLPAEWVGYQRHPGLHNFGNRSQKNPAFADRPNSGENRCASSSEIALRYASWQRSWCRSHGSSD